jgi:hypothetical protein
MRYQHSTAANQVYKALGEFHLVARKDMGLPPVDYERVEQEIRKYYDY